MTEGWQLPSGRIAFVTSVKERNEQVITSAFAEVTAAAGSLGFEKE